MTKEPIDHVTQKNYTKIDAENDERKKNDKFVQLYERKMKEIRDHTAKNHNAVILFLFLAEFMGADNIVIVPQQVLIDELKFSRSTLYRSSKYLEEQNLVVVVKFGNCNGYAMNPEYVWKSFNTPEKFALFSNVKAMASKSENEAMKKKLSHVFGRKKGLKAKPEPENNVDTRQLDIVELCESEAKK